MKHLVEESAEELFEDAPCGYLTTDLDGRLLRVNRTFESWTGRRREDLVDRLRFLDVLSPGGRIYYETHYLPLLLMQGWVREIAVDIVRADGSRLPALVNAVLRHDAEGRPAAIRTTVFDATDRRRYEEELRRSRDREQEVARRLQESLLDQPPVDDPRLALGVRYLPSAAGLQVGGDWYDAFPLDENRYAIVIGDVVGRGLDAAATMGQLRSAIRALAATGLGPGGLLGALDAYVARHGVGGMATVAYVELDAATGVACLACAGHPPPVLAAPGAEPVYVMSGRSAPLDAQLDPAPRPEGVFELPPRSLLVLFTDGLVERANRSLQASLDGLLAQLRAMPADVDPTRLVHALSEELPTGEHADDVCVVAARWTGP